MVADFNGVPDIAGSSDEAPRSKCLYAETGMEALSGHDGAINIPIWRGNSTSIAGIDPFNAIPRTVASTLHISLRRRWALQLCGGGTDAAARCGS